MFRKTKKMARRSIGLLAFMGALLWGNHASAETVVDIDVYQGSTLLESEGMVFGLTANGSGDNVVRPPGTPSPTATEVYFLNSTWIEDENNNPITVKLTEDYHTIGSVSEVWTIEVKNPTDGELYLSFDGTPFDGLGTLVLNSLDAEEGETGYYNNKDIVGIFTGVNKLPVSAGLYSIAYTYTPSADLIVYCRDLDGNSLGGWQYSYTGDSAVYPGVGQWYAPGATEAVEKDKEFTVSFQPVDKYETPNSYTATMPISGSGLSYTAVYKKQDVRSFDITYEFKNQDDSNAPVPATALVNMTWSVYEVDDLGDPVETDPITGDPVYYVENDIFQFAAHVSGFDSAGNEVSQTGTTLRSLPFGNWKVVFNDVDFKDGSDGTVVWTTPSAVDVTVDTAEQVVAKTGVYGLIPGELTVTPVDYTIYETDSTGFEVEFTVTSAPIDDIVVSVAPVSGNGTKLQVDKSSFTVTAGAVFPYTEIITVTPVVITGLQGPTLENVTISITASENDPRYVTGTENVNVTIIDADNVDATSGLSFIPNDVIDFGEVVLGQPETRYIVVNNVKDYDQVIEFFFIGEQIDFEIAETTPITVPETGSYAIPVNMTGIEAGTYSTELVIVLSDGQTIVETITLSGEVVDPSGIDLEVFLDPAVVVANSGNSDAVEFSVSVFANTTSVLTASDSVVLTVPAEVDLSGLANTATLTFDDAAKTITYVEDTKEFVADSETIVIEFTAPVDVTTEKIVPLTIVSSLGTYDVITQNGQLAITDAIQLATLDVDDNGFVNFLDTRFIYNTLVIWNGDQGNTSPVHPDPATATTIIEIIQSSGDAYDVDGNGFVNFLDTRFIYNTIVLWNKDLNNTSAVHPDPTVADTIIANVKKIYPELY